MMLTFSYRGVRVGEASHRSPQSRLRRNNDRSRARVVPQVTGDASDDDQSLGGVRAGKDPVLSRIRSREASSERGSGIPVLGPSRSARYGLRGVRVGEAAHPGPCRDRSRSRDFHEETARPTQLDSDNELLVPPPSWVTRNRFAALQNVNHIDGAQGAFCNDDVDSGARCSQFNDNGCVDEGLLDSLEHDLREPRRRRTKRRIQCESDSDSDVQHRWRESQVLINGLQDEIRADSGEATTVVASTNAVRVRNEMVGGGFTRELWCYAKGERCAIFHSAEEFRVHRELFDGCRPASDNPNFVKGDQRGTSSSSSGATKCPQ